MNNNIYTEEEQYWCRGGNTGTLPTRITPTQVNVLADGEIFVFGSNFQGRHIGGAAKYAKDQFGAVWGIGEGLQGRSYAIPTMEGLENLAPAVVRFTSFARQHKELKFFVTEMADISARKLCPILSTAYGLAISRANDNIKMKPFNDLFDHMRDYEEDTTHPMSKAYRGRSTFGSEIGGVSYEDNDSYK